MKKSTQIGTIECNLEGPTTVTTQQLYAWVIWQFPKEANQSMASGAVCPPIEHAEWIPAKIDFNQDEILLYAHLEAYYSSPEAAHQFFKQD